MRKRWQLVGAICGVAIFICGTVMAAEAPAGKGKHVFILSGQSNMREPLPGAFTESVAQVFGKDNVIVAMVAAPSQPIKQWYKLWAPPADPKSVEAVDKGANGQLYDKLLTSVKKKISGQKLASVTFIWMQGEADAGSGWGSVYEKSFYGILDQFKKDLDLRTINFVVGRINDCWLSGKGTVDGDVVRGVQVKMGEAHEYGDWVDTDDLNTGVNPWRIFEIDGGHFPPAAYRVLGQRFARKACKIIDPQIKLDDRCFDAVFYDSTENIKTHAAVNKVITGTKPDPKHADAKSGLATLVDGKYGSIDKPDTQWLGFVPAPDGVEFVIDLGKSEDVSGVAANILVDPAVGAAIPKKVTIVVSKDGTKFEDGGSKSFHFNYKAPKPGKGDSELKRRPVLLFAESAGASGQYIKIKIITDDSRLFVDEIIVNPVAKKHPFPVEASRPMVSIFIRSPSLALASSLPKP